MVHLVYHGEVLIQELEGTIGNILLKSLMN